MKVNIIDMSRNAIIDIVESEKEPRIGETITMSSGAVLLIEKARKIAGKNFMEAYVRLSLKHHIFPNNRPPYAK
jgi:hypothetical protein